MLSIRTQDRMTLVPYTNAPIRTREDGAIFMLRENNNNHTKLGQYATKERALEVLDEIQGAIVKNEVIDNSNERVLCQNIHNKVNYYSPRQTVYQMPKE